LADELGLSPNTVHNHVKGMLKRAGVGTKSALLALLLQTEVAAAASQPQAGSRASVLLLPGCEALAPGLTDLGLSVRCAALRDDGSAPSIDASVVVSPWRSSAEAERVRKRAHLNYGVDALVLFTSSAADGIQCGPTATTAVLPMLPHRVAFEILLCGAKDAYERSRLLRTDASLQAVVDERIAARITSLGFGGAFVSLPAAQLGVHGYLRPGHLLSLAVTLPDGSVAVLNAAVAWVRTSERPAWPSGVGVRFKGKPDEDLARVQEAVRLGRLGLMQLTSIQAAGASAAA
jgi:hypothetical protein